MDKLFNSSLVIKLNAAPKCLAMSSDSNAIYVGYSISFKIRAKIIPFTIKEWKTED